MGPPRNPPPFGAERQQDSGPARLVAMHRAVVAVDSPDPAQALRQLERGALALEESHRLQRHGAEQRGLPAVELGAEDRFPHRAHDHYGPAGLEELDGPEGALPVAKE